MKKRSENILQEPQADYAKAESDLLLQGLERNYTERFLMMTNLMKRSIMLSKASIKHKPSPSSK